MIEFRTYKPNSVSANWRTIIIYLGSLLPTTSSGTSRQRRDPALHAGKDLAVSTPPYGGNHLPDLTGRRLFSFVASVSVRTSRIAPDGRYPLPVYPPAGGCVFGLSSPTFGGGDYPIRNFTNYNPKLL